MSKNEKKTYDLSADGGNTSIKVIYDGKFTNYDNIYAKDSSIEYDAMNFDDEDMDEFLRDILNVRFTWHLGAKDEMVQEFLFGKLATNNKSDVDERVNADKSDDIMLNMVTILSGVNFMLENMDEKELKPEMELDINLSTGLPYHEYRIKTLRDKYAEHFLGSHIIENIDPRYPVKKIKVNIKNCKVNSEGMSALYTTITTKGIINEDTKDELLDTVWCMIDIGGYTTDIVGGIFREKKNGFKLETIDRLGKGLTYGISTAQDRAIDNIKKKYTDNDQVKSSFKITRKEITVAEMKEGDLKGILNNKFKTNTTEFTNPEYKKIGKNIGNDFTQLFIKNAQMDSLKKIYVAGGGSLNEVVVSTLIKELVSRGIDKDIIEVITSPNPVYVNAVSYYYELQKSEKAE